MCSGDLQKGFGYANFVVEVGVGFVNLTRCAQDGGDQLLGGGFARRTGHAHDGDVCPIAPGSSQGLIGRQGIGDDQLRTGLVDRLLNDRRHGPRRDRPRHKRSPIKIFATQGHKQLP